MIEGLFREDLRDFKPYEAEINFCSTKLDANESFFSFPQELRSELLEVIENTLLNRYPDPASKEVCRLYAIYSGVPRESILAGNGSDELIQIIVNTFVTKGDKVAMLYPDFSMYSIYTRLSGGIPVEIPLNSDFSLDVNALIQRVNTEKIKVLFISNPNNPTGGIIPEEGLLTIIEETNGLVVIDEAYYEFYGKTLAQKVNLYDNLIVLRTCSKAMGLAALRLGFLITNILLINELKKVKPPFNVNSLTQSIGALLLKHPELVRKNTDEIIKERKSLLKELRDVECVTEVFPSEANFILIKSTCADVIKDRAMKSGISIRSFSRPYLKDFLRITVGSSEENKAFIKAINKQIEYK